MKRLALALLALVLAGCAALPAADHHQHLLRTRGIDADSLVAMLDAAGVQRAVLLSVAYQHHGDYARVRDENDWTAAQAARHPQRLLAFCSVDPLQDDALTEIERCAADPRTARGLKLHFGNSDIQLDEPRHVGRMKSIFAAANQRGMALVIHLRASVSRKRPYEARHARVFVDELLPLAYRVPVQIAHMASTGPGYDDPGAREVLRVLIAGAPKNLWFDMAGLMTADFPTDEAQRLVDDIRAAGVQRVLFGCDAALAPNLAPKDCVAAFERLPLTKEERAQMARNVAPYFH